MEHNTRFLRACLNHDKFLSGELSTAFIAEEFPDGYAGTQLSTDDAQEMRAVAAALYLQAQALAFDPDRQGFTEPFEVAVKLGAGVVAGDAEPEDVTVWVLPDESGHSCAVSESPDGPVLLVGLSWLSERLQHATLVEVDSDDYDGAQPCAEVASTRFQWVLGVDFADDRDAGDALAASSVKSVQIPSAPAAGTAGGKWSLQFQGAVGDVWVRPAHIAALEEWMPVAVRARCRPARGLQRGSLPSCALGRRRWTRTSSCSLRCQAHWCPCPCPPVTPSSLGRRLPAWKP